MSMITPAGWYPDASAPGQERWWDGAAWTGHTRPEAAAPAPPSPPVPRHGPPPIPPAAPLGPPGTAHGPGAAAPGGSAPGGPRRRPALLAAVAVVVLAACAAGALLLRGGDGGGPAHVAKPPAGPSGAGTAAEGPKGAPEGGEKGGEEGPAELADQLSGISLPVPHGWEEAHTSLDGATTVWTEGPFNCPGDPIFCRRGRMSSRPLPADGASGPEAMARRDIADAADALYGTHPLGLEPYGGITSHEEVAAEAVTVAGRDGYLVRWRVVTGAGPGGFVQSVAFPSETGPDSLVVVRFALDAGPEGPPVTLLDELPRGIRALGG
ncbi:hypothetical protein GCM10023329_11140 [Streptomyces sanyensis]|uniref:DUF2510 domain-containing protein n=1 Tax=Streptomyces sanyensis TaxID=568869 RepID=A0ABP8ZUQ2_9ACTN